MKFYIQLNDTIKGMKWTHCKNGHMAPNRHTERQTKGAGSKLRKLIQPVKLEFSLFWMRKYVACHHDTVQTPEKV